MDYLSSARTGPIWRRLRAPVLNLPEQSIVDIAKLGRGRNDVIPLWFGEGDLQTPKFICDAASRAMAEGKTFYTQVNGVPEFREELSRYMSGLYGTPIDAGRITVTAGGMGAIMLCAQLLVDDGDNVVVVDPIWPNIRGIIQVMGGESRPVLKHCGHDGWSLDLDEVAAACDERTKAVFVNSPCNPTGWVMMREQQRELLEFCRARGIWVIADEVYARLAFDAPHAPSFLQIAEPDDRLLVINSFSKAWAMTGWRLGWLTHPPELFDTMGKLMLFTTSGATTFAQAGAITALRDGEEFVARVRERCRTGRDIVCAALEAMPRAQLLARPKGAMYVYFQVQGFEDSHAFCTEAIEKTGVGLAPGTNFGPGSEQFVRLCCFRAADQLAQAMSRLEAILG
ncbi:MAG: pyridoxal phosphate-dependent aminotransferase [Sphingomonadales bacterium]